MKDSKGTHEDNGEDLLGSEEERRIHREFLREEKRRVEKEWKEEKRRSISDIFVLNPVKAICVDCDLNALLLSSENSSEYKGRLTNCTNLLACRRARLEPNILKRNSCVT